MLAKTSPEIAKAVGVIMELSEDERTRLSAEARDKFRRDEEARWEDTFEDGKEYGWQKVRLEGREKGELKVRREVARRLLQKTQLVEMLAEVAGLSLEEVKALALELPIMH